MWRSLSSPVQPAGVQYALSLLTVTLFPAITPRVKTKDVCVKVQIRRATLGLQTSAGSFVKAVKWGEKKQHTDRKPSVGDKCVLLR